MVFVLIKIIYLTIKTYKIEKKLTFLSIDIFFILIPIINCFKKIY